MNFDLNLYNTNDFYSQNPSDSYDYQHQDIYHNNDHEDFVEPPKTTKRKKKSSDGKIKKKYKSGPLRPFTPFSGSNFRMWNYAYGCPEPMNKTQLTIHKKFMTVTNDRRIFLTDVITAYFITRLVIVHQVMENVPNA